MSSPTPEEFNGIPLPTPSVPVAGVFVLPVGLIDALHKRVSDLEQRVDTLELTHEEQNTRDSEGC